MTDTVNMGTDELAMRNRLGDAGFEAWRTRQSLLDDYQVATSAATVLQAGRLADVVRAQAVHTSARAAFWLVLTVSVAVLTLCSAALLVWVMAR